MAAFPNVRFLTSAHQVSQLPPDVGAEVAVAGRSNAGKSSAINAIDQRTGLAKTSKTPGATRLINLTLRATQAGSSAVRFQNADLLGSQNPPEAKPGIAFFGGIDTQPSGTSLPGCIAPHSGQVRASSSS